LGEKGRSKGYTQLPKKENKKPEEVRERAFMSPEHTSLTLRMTTNITTGLQLKKIKSSFSFPFMSLTWHLVWGI
jgi:hypothetical protein